MSTTEARGSSALSDQAENQNWEEETENPCQSEKNDVTKVKRRNIIRKN